MRRILLACLFGLALAGTTPALPHHSTANFDSSQKVTVKGKVVFFRLTSPHSHIDIEVPVPGGAARPYKIFTVARTVMTRSGWTEADMKVGDEITITGNPDRTDPTFMYLTSIVFASGKTWDWELIR